MRGNDKKEKNEKGEKNKGPSLSRALLFTLTISASWLYVFTNYPGTRKGAKTWRSGINLHSYCFVPLLLFLLPFKTRKRDGISRGHKETEQESFMQQNLWVRFPQGFVWLPCGCNVFVHPSPPITIMSLERSVRVEFVGLWKNLHESLCRRGYSSI